MKRILVLSLVALSGFALSSCSEEDTAKIQEQLPAVTQAATTAATNAGAAPEANPAPPNATPQTCQGGKTPDGSGVCSN